MIFRSLSRSFLRPHPGIRINKLVSSRAMHITSIPMWVGSSNNYAYVIKDDATNDAVVIDPAHPEEVVPVLQSQIEGGQIKLTSIINTHHHWDHSGGNNEILSHFKGLKVIGGKDCQSVSTTPPHGEKFKLGKDISIQALHTPCHTQDSICWFVEDGDDRAVFTGDTLFIGGCGKFFEGTGPEMNKALNEILAGLPEDTKVYPGHEYTKQNCKFLLKVQPSDAVKSLQNFAENNRETQGKFTIADEKKHNVFMRPSDPEIQKATGKTEPADVVGTLRHMKDTM